MMMNFKRASYDHLYCHVCKKYFNSTEQLSEHEKGQSHLKLSEEQSSSASCVNVTTVQHAESNTHTLNDVSRSNSRSETPVKEMNFRAGSDQGRTNSPQQNQYSDSNDYVFDNRMNRGQCLICLIDLTSSQHARQHLSGKNHEKKKNNLRQRLTSPGLTAGQFQGTPASTIGLAHYLDRNTPSPQNAAGNIQGSDSNILMCKLCNAPFSSVFNMQQHFAGARHLKELRKREMDQNSPGRQAAYNLNSEQTKPKEFNTGLYPNNPPSCDETLASSSESGVRSEQRIATDSTGFAFHSAGDPSPSPQSSLQTVNDNRIQFRHSLSNNLSEFNDKVTQLKDKQMMLSQQPLSIVDNNQQPSTVLGNIGLNQEVQSHRGPFMAHDTPPSHLVRPSEGSLVMQRDGHALDTRNNLIPGNVGLNQEVQNYRGPVMAHDTPPSHLVRPSEGSLVMQRDGHALDTRNNLIPRNVGLNQEVQNYRGPVMAHDTPPSHLVRPSEGSLVMQRDGHALDTRNNSIPTTPNASPQNTGEREKGYEFDGVRGFCYICDVVLTSWKLAQQHLNGQQHCKKSANWGGSQLPLQGNSTRFSTPSSNDDNENTDPLSVHATRESPSHGYYHFDGNKGFCRACNSELSSPMQATQHLEGKQHKRNALRMESAEKGVRYPLFCEICQKPFTGQESARQHFISDKHQRNESLSKGTVLEVLDGAMKVLKDGEIWYFCNVCRKVLNNLEQLNIHQRSHDFSQLESSRGSPGPASVACEAERNTGTVGYQGPVGQFSPYSRENSRSSMDQVSLDHIKELLTYGENPVVNAEFSPLRANAFDPLRRSQETANACTDTVSAATLQAQVESRQIKGREFTGQALNNYNQSQMNAHGNFLLKGGDFLRVSSTSNNQMSPDDNLKLSGFQPIPDPWNSGSAFHAIRGNASGGSGNSVNPSRQTRETTNTTAYRETENDGELLRGRYSNDQEISSIFGNVMTGVKPSTNKTGNRDRGHRSVVNLDQAEHEESSDDDDENGDSRMNIQGEERQPVIETAPQPSTLPPNYDVIRNKHYCKLCDRQMNASKSYKDHLSGKLHQWNLSSSKVPFKLQDPINKSCDLQAEDYQSAFEMTKTCPRGYQIQLMKAAMTTDCVVYLPTGTGKTMVSVLTIGKMLEKNPKRPVIFLVDKVLLVIQQSRYIKTEFEGKKFKRASLQRNTNGDDNGEIVERELTLAFVCGGLLCTNNLPIWQHDIIVTTADYCINMLKNGSVVWEDFSMAVLDEVHHCVKSHPYRKLIQDFHLKENYPKRPKILGLTASPAGKSSVEATYTMLQSLLQELGGANIAIVGEDRQNELKLYQSNTSLHAICVPLTDKEKDFQAQCFKYFLRCYIKLAPLCTSMKNYRDPPCSYFYDVLNQPNEETIEVMTNSLLKDDSPLSDILPFILESKCVKDAEEKEKNTYDSLRSHTFKVLLHIADISTGVDFEEMKTDFKESETNHILKDIKLLGLPCETFYKQILVFEQVEGNEETTMTGKLIQILQDPSYADWTKQEAMALVLVRQRKNAKSLSRCLRHKAFVQNNSLRVTHLVGHGKGTQDKGMAVKDQKKVLDNQKKFNIIIATSIAEEGVDINTVELVVSMNPPTNVTALVQMRGRARKMGSHFVILCSSHEEMMKLEELQQHEKNMTEAAEMCLAQQQGPV